jgi:apolipoprotein N-acyltransferase
LGRKLQYSNSACTNQKVQVYHKGKLVPGVEIFPYMSVLKPILGDAMLNLGGTVASLGTDKERVAFSNPYNKGKMAPIICYESIYGEFVTDYVKKGANFLGIMTNDSWWGVTEGHKQLLSYARLRAIETEEKLPVLPTVEFLHINAKGRKQILFMEIKPHYLQKLIFMIR